MAFRSITPGHLLRALVATAITVTFIALPLYSLISAGGFSWHVQQPSLVQGLAEIAVLGLAMYACAWIQRRAAWVALILLIFLFARRHGVDISIAMVYLYIEGIYALGANLYEIGRRLGHAEPPASRCVVTTAGAGLTTWLLLTWLHSLVGAAQVISIQSLALIVLGGCIVSNRTDPLYRRMAQWLACASRQSPACFALFLATFFGFFAKAAVVINYDSMWYGLQLEKTLIPHGSLFDPTGLVAPVYYYPKLYESLLLPLTGSQSTSTLFGLALFSLFIAAALLPAIWQFTQAGNTRPSKPTWWPILLPFTIPVLLNFAVQTKGDVFSACCFIAAVYCACRCVEMRSRSWALLGLSFTGFAVLARLSALPYAALMVLILLTLGFRHCRQREASFEASIRIATFMLSLAVAALVLYRGLLLAGVPFISPHAVVALESRLGMDIKYPVGQSLAGGAGRERIPLLHGLVTYVLMPARAFILRVSWPGNSWLLAFVLAALATRRKPRTLPLAMLLAIGLLGLFILFTFPFKPGWGADGNYFIIPFLCLALAGASFLPRRGFAPVLLGVVAVAGVFVAQLTGSWHPGTRPFDFAASRDNKQLLHRRERGLDRVGLSGVADYLRAAAPTSHSIGIMPAHGGLVEPGWFLPSRFEAANIINWARPELISSMANLKQFACRTHLDYVILPTSDKPERKLTQRLQQFMATAHAQRWATVAYSDANYTVWELNVQPGATCAPTQSERGHHQHLTERR